MGGRWWLPGAVCPCGRRSLELEEGMAGAAGDKVRGNRRVHFPGMSSAGVGRGSVLGLGAQNGICRDPLSSPQGVVV